MTKGMYKVRDNRTGQVRTVYAVNGLLFLLFADGHWCWEDMSFYTPVEDEQ